MAQHPVLGHQGGAQGVGVFIEHAVVAHAQAHHNVELGACGVEHLGLEDGVAGVGPYGVAGLGDAQVHLLHHASLAAHAEDLKAVGAEDAGQNAGLVEQAYAGGDADLVKAQLLGKLHDLLDPGVLAVVLTLHLGGRHHGGVVVRLLVADHRLLQYLLLQVLGQAEGRKGVGVVQVVAGSGAAVDAVAATGVLFHKQAFFL